MKEHLKKLFALIIAIAIILPIIPAAYAVMSFYDVPYGQWYYDSVEICYSNGWMNGVGNNRFDPDGKMTRAMLVTVLHRAIGTPSASSNHPFTDVPNSTYFSDAVSWAYENNVVNGTSEVQFSPDKNISRQEMITIFYRYAKSSGYNTATTLDISSFQDAGEISSYALDALRWGVSVGIINGVGNNMLSPNGNATRAQCAKIIVSYMNWTNSQDQDSDIQDPLPSDPSGIIDFQETVVVDNEECTIKITGINFDDSWEYILNAYFENKSSDKNYMFAVRSAAINGVECDPYFATEVSAGKKANKEIGFTKSRVEEMGLTKCTDIELTFAVSNSDDWSEADIVEKTIHIYPYGEDQATIYQRPKLPSDNILVDNEYVTIIVTGYEHDDWEYSVNLFLVNKTDTHVMYSVDDVSVNDYMIDPFFATSVIPGKCKFSSFSWSNNRLAENGITKIENIEFTLQAYDDEDWYADKYVNRVFALYP